MAKQAGLNSALSPADLEDLFREMVFLRHFEEKTNQAFRMGKAGGYLHVYIGSESLAMGWLHRIRKGYDYVITAYRDHAHALVLGCDPVEVMAEIMGKAGGLSRGKGGSMHLYSKEKQFYGGWGIVGGHTALGGGLALAAKYRNEDRVTLCYLGDGAANAGVFYESLNMAGLWNLPVVFIIENNQYAMGTSIERHAADTELQKRAIPFGIRHERLDSQDLIQVLQDAERIVETVRADSKPYLIEAMTYRFAGHGAADHDRSLYRSREEEISEETTDPVRLLEAYLEAQKLMTREKMEAIDEEMLAEADRVFHAADELPYPDEDEVYDHVYTDMTPEVGH